jgi:hemoglobin
MAAMTPKGSAKWMRDILNSDCSTKSLFVPFLLPIPPSDAVDQMVEMMYERLTADEQLKVFFEGVSVPRLKLHQKRFLTLLFTKVPEGLDLVQYMIDTHARLWDKGLDGSTFDAVGAHVVAVCQEMQVPDDVMSDILSVVGALRPVFAEEGERIANAKKY